jgi:hypothetical protein
MPLLGPGCPPLRLRPDRAQTWRERLAGAPLGQLLERTRRRRTRFDRVGTRVSNEPRRSCSRGMRKVGYVTSAGSPNGSRRPSVPTYQTQPARPRHMRLLRMVLRQERRMRWPWLRQGQLHRPQLEAHPHVVQRRLPLRRPACQSGVFRLRRGRGRQLFRPRS